MTGGVWPGVQDHAGSTGTDTHTIGAWRDKRFGEALSSHHTCCALKEHFLLLQALLSSPLSFSVLRGMRVSTMYSITFTMIIHRVSLCLFLLVVEIFVQLSHFGETHLSCGVRTLKVKFQFYSREAK